MLSEKLEGDVLHPIWFRDRKDVEEMFGPGSYPVFQARKFRFHWFLTTNTGVVRRKIAAMWFYVSKGLQVYRERRFDCIVTYSHMATGLCAVVLKLLTGAKLIVEITTSLDLVYPVKKRNLSPGEWIMRLYSYLCLHICLWTCDRAQLRGPGLIERYRMLRNVPTSILVGFVPVSTIPRHVESSEKSVIFVGAPWYLKGADVLIEAFRRLSGEFPDVKLRLLGYYPDREQLDALTGGSPQIEILKARSNPEVLELISKALILVLPSRCEGAPRVVIEAMAAGIPVIGSGAGAIPYLIRDGYNGFVVPVGDVSALETRLRRLLSEADLRRTMGERGYALAHSKFSEQAYVEQFTRAVTEVVGERGSR